MQSRIEESSSLSSITNNGKKKRRSKDLSMMELIEQVKTHKTRTLESVSEQGRHLPKQRSYPTSNKEDYWMKQYSDSSDDSDGAMSEPVPTARPQRPTTARGRRRVSVDLSAPSSTGSEQGSTDSPRFDEDLMTPNRSSHNTGSHQSRSKSRMSNQQPLKYKREKESKEILNLTQGQTGRSRNLPPLSRELSYVDAPHRQSPPFTKLGRETSVLSSIQSTRASNQEIPKGSPQGHCTSGDPFTLERQRTIILEQSQSQRSQIYMDDS